MKKALIILVAVLFVLSSTVAYAEAVKSSGGGWQKAYDCIKGWSWQGCSAAKAKSTDTSAAATTASAPACGSNFAKTN